MYYDEEAENADTQYVLKQLKQSEESLKVGYKLIFKHKLSCILFQQMNNSQWE